MGGCTAIAPIQAASGQDLGTHCLPHETMPSSWVRVGWAGLGQPQLPLDPTRAGPELSSSGLALPQSPSARRRMEEMHCHRSHPGCARPGTRVRVASPTKQCVAVGFVGA